MSVMKSFDRAKDRARIRRVKRKNVLVWERLESRRMMSIFTVSTTNGAPNTNGSLASAITHANEAPGSTINFSVTGVINLTTSSELLPAITAPTTIQGTTTAGAAPVIVIDGNGLTGDGLVLASGSQGSTIEGLDIVNFAGAGIHIESGGDTIKGNYLGVSLDGATAGPGNQTGVMIDNVPNATIGGTTSAASNVIAANTLAGVSISGSSATDNRVAGNLIGTDTAGSIAIGNGIGVMIDDGASSNTIGGTFSAAANVIAGSTTAGVSISGSLATGNLVAANLIGIDAAGDNLGNVIGLAISDAGNTIGGTTTGSANVIGFNSSAGVSISGSSATGNLLIGNLVGTDESGSAQPGNGIGIIIGNGASNNTIGGTISAAANVIAANTIAGVSITGSSSTGNLVVGNDIGTNASNQSLGNVEGIVIDGAPGATIGGTTTGAGNAVDFNTTAGIEIIGTSDSDNTKALIEANWIGTDAGGDNLGNGTGIQVINASSNTIGGTTSGSTSAAANTIGFNSTAGVSIFSGNDNSVQSNTFTATNGRLTIPSTAANDIGVANGANNNQPPPELVSASLSSGNDELSLALVSTSNATTLDVYVLDSNQRKFLGEQNVPANQSLVMLPVSGLIAGDKIIATATVAGNGTSTFAAPISIATATTVTNTNSSGPGSLAEAIAAARLGSVINFDIPGPGNTFVIDLSSALTIEVPLTIDGTTNLGVPATVELDGGGGAFDGLILASGSDGSQIEGLTIENFGGAGIFVESTDNTIGGTAVGVGNVIGSNTGAGVSISGSSARGNVLQGNFIGTNSTGGTTIPNGIGVVIDNGASNNTIGGTTASAANVIAASTTAGVSISGSLSTGNLVAGDFIGTNSTNINLANAEGVAIAGAIGNTIGGTASAFANVIGFNSAAGVSISGSSTQGNLIAGNFIGTNSAGGNLNNIVGVAITDADNTIGGTTAGAANVIGFNSSAAVSISGAAATGNLIAGNDIGTNSAGTADLGNGAGIVIDNGGATTGNMIGGAAAVAGNSIANSTGDAIDIVSGRGNAIRLNMIYGNGGAIALAQSVNSEQAAPSGLSVTSVTDLTTINYTLTGTSGDSYSVDFFASTSAGSPAAQVLGTTTVKLNSVTQTFTMTFAFATPLSSNQTVTATATGPDNTTSESATPTTVTSPFLVTTTADSGPGSLRQAILNANENSSEVPTTISFDIPSASTPYIIALQSPLPNITQPVVIDAATQPGYLVSPIVELDGQGTVDNGLSLLANSNTIEGLELVDFAMSGILIQSNDNLVSGNFVGTDPTGSSPGPGDSIGISIAGSDNTIGGAAVGAGNVIAFNTASGAAGAGVEVMSGSENAILQNSIFQNNVGIINNSQDAPTLATVTATSKATIIAGQVPTPDQDATYTLEFFSSGIIDPPPGDQARVFLGSVQVTPSTTGTASFNATIPVAVQSGLTVTATVTETNTSNGTNTSPFATSLTVSGSFMVTTTATSGPGSLSQAITDADETSGSSTIKFNITSGSGYDPATNTATITLVSALPVITEPVSIDGTTQPGDVIENGSSVVDGLDLGSGSSGSEISGLTLTGFTGAGILIASSDNTIGGTVSGAGNTIAGNTGDGVKIDGDSTSPSNGNIILGNTIDNNRNTNNTSAGVEVDATTGNPSNQNTISSNLIYQNDQGIVFVNGANDGIRSPTITGVNSVGAPTTIQGQLQNLTPSSAYILEFFSSAPGDNISILGQAHVLLGSTEILTDSNGNASFVVSFPIAMLPGQVVTATATSAAGDTSEFATAQSVASPSVVTTTADNGNDSAAVVGSLRQVIENAIKTNGSTPFQITFQIPGTGPFVIEIPDVLPTITVPVDIQGGAEAAGAIVELDGGGNSFDGLILGTGSEGSSIDELGIANFAGDGIEIDSSDNTITGDLIGTNSQGTASGPGNKVGILVVPGASDNTIGGTSTGAGNIIAFNTVNGIDVNAGTGNEIRMNTIFQNGTLQNAANIILSNGANGSIQPPSLFTATSNAGVTVISGELTFEASATTATDTIEFFSSSAADALVPQAQADRFLGSETILLTAGETSATFNQTLMVSVSLGLTITATVTSNETGTLIYNTSELASSVTAFNAFIVTNTAASGPGSLAQAILNSNASESGPNAIEFQIPQNTQQPPTEVYTIALNATTGFLPPIDRAVFINGGSETSYLDSILATPLEIPAIIEIDGPGLSGGLPGDGLVLASGSDGSTIQGLDIVNFLGAAIDIETSGNTISANTLGIDLSASSLPGNTSGILIDGSGSNIAANNIIGGTNTTIGGSTNLLGNTIGSNTSAGISITGSGATGNSILGNFIGTDPSQHNYSNSTGIEVTASASGNAIGGTVLGTANTIGDNMLAGISLTGSAGTGNVVIGNTIELNDGIGVAVAASQNTVGGTAAGSGNIIVSNNTGIELEASDVLVQGNFIGTDPENARLANMIGILIEGVANDTIGGTTATAANIIGFNNTGVSITGSSASGNVVVGNDIGVDPADLNQNLGNAIGVVLDSGAFGNTIGGTDSGTANLIGDNSQAGISLTGSAGTGNSVIGNDIGTDPARPAIKLDNGIGVAIAASQNTVGGTTSGSSNIIGFNSTGIELNASNILVVGNDIGTDSAGDNLGNTTGVFVNGVSSDTIGGTAAAAANIIGFNTIAGVSIIGVQSSTGESSANSNVVWGNFIGTDATSADLGNKTGILLSNASGNSIGATLSGPINGNDTIGAWFSAVFTVRAENGQPVANSTISGVGNIIGFNTSAGISISAAGSAMPGNTVIANLIGTNATLQSLANATGIVLDDTGDNSIGQSLASLGFAYSNTIGGVLTGSVSVVGTIPFTFSTAGSATLGGTVSASGGVGNVILGNSGDGISISGTIDELNTVEGNLISRNGTNGVHLVGDLGGGSSLLQISENYIGTGPTGATTYQSGTDESFGNGLSGVLLEATMTATTTVVAVTVSGNVISGNGLNGITVQASPGYTGKTAATADVAIKDNYIGTDMAGANVGTGSNANSLPFGNVLDGIQLDDVSGVTIGAVTEEGGPVSLNLATSLGNLIAGNLGRGIEITNGASDNLVGGNLIGVVLASDASGHTILAAKDAANNASNHNTGNVTGNLSDGIFILDSTSNTIQGNVISANRGNGIHAVGESSSPATIIDLTVEDNFIGTNQDGTLILDANGNGFGNSADGILLDSVSAVTIGGTSANGSVVRNLISGNDASGIDLLDAAGVLVTGNLIGTDVGGLSSPGQPDDDFGNDSNGIFINQSHNVTIGGTITGAGNTISGNHDTGVFVSGANSTVGGTTADDNVIEGNDVGIGFRPDGQAEAVPNAVAGIILSNADNNTIGGPSTSFANVISGNSLDGILLINDADQNVVESNDIGTDPTASFALANSADGVFLLAVTTLPNGNTVGGTITGNTVKGNTISGNNDNGLELFGTGASGNLISGNMIGVGSNGKPIPNNANGVYLNNAGINNTIGGLTSTPGTSPGNVIAGNGQAGINISSTDNIPTETTVEGNLIGIDAADTAVGNRSYGVAIYGSSSNTIGGSNLATGSLARNVISGNGAAGIEIDSPSSSALAQYDVVAGNLIGTSISGLGGIGNGSDGVQIIDGQFDTIGGTSPADLNVISGNADNGVFIDQVPGSNVPSLDNQVVGNDIGTNIFGSTAVPNLGSGVEIADGSGNMVGGTGGVTIVPGTEVPMPMSGAVGNLISGNLQWGIQILLTGASAGEPQTAIEGNDIGLDISETYAIGNGQGGVLVDNLSNTLIGQMIGGAAPTAGNMISGNSNAGVELIGPQVLASGRNNIVEGNLIGLNALGGVVTSSNGLSGNGTGILINNSPDNLIGGTGASTRNVISGNSQYGVEISQIRSAGNEVEGNFIGTNLAGNGYPSGSQERTPAQSVGVLVDGVSGDTVGGITSGASNVISGNDVGVEISNLKLNGSQIIGSGDFVEGNLIGTDASGTQPVSNLDLGVFVDNAQGNVIGPGNDIAANGIAGVEIFSEESIGNLVTGNTIGEGINGQVFSARNRSKLSSNAPEPGIPVYTDAQLHGVVILGASQNTIGLNKKIGGKANAISGNVQVGVYITSRDYNGLTYTVPVGNAVSGNTIRSNGVYGVLLYDSPNNSVPPFDNHNSALVSNKYRANPTSFRNFQGAFQGASPLTTHSSKPKRRAKTAERHSPIIKHPISVRPRIPALFEPKKTHNTRAAERPHGKQRHVATPEPAIESI
jgi:hypothetical protein